MIDIPLFGVGKQIASGSFIHLSSVINSAFLLKEIGYSGVQAGATKIVFYLLYMSSVNPYLYMKILLFVPFLLINVF